MYHIVARFHLHIEVFDHLTFSSANHITGCCTREGEKCCVSIFFSLYFCTIKKMREKRCARVRGASTFCIRFTRRRVSIFFYLWSKQKKEKNKNLMHRLCASDKRGAMFQYCCKTNVRHLWEYRSPSCKVGLAFFKFCFKHYSIAFDYKDYNAVFCKDVRHLWGH